MNVHELNHDQMVELKQRMLADRNDGVSYGELADADSLVSDGEVYEKYGGTAFSADDFNCSAGEPDGKGGRSESVTAWVAEMSKGRYLKINDCEDGNGTWFDTTPSIWEAHWDKNLENLSAVCETEFYDYEEGYPKYHKVQFDCKFLSTAV